MSVFGQVAGALVVAIGVGSGLASYLSQRQRRLYPKGYLLLQSATFVVAGGAFFWYGRTGAAWANLVFLAAMFGGFWWQRRWARALADPSPPLEHVARTPGPVELLKNPWGPRHPSTSRPDDGWSLRYKRAANRAAIDEWLRRHPPEAG